MTYSYSLKDKRVWVAGHTGMVGSAIIRQLQDEGCREILKVTRQEVNLLSQASVTDWLAEAKPDAIFLAAAKVGGILANDNYPAEFLYENLMIASNIIHGAHRADIDRLLFLGSSCIYPKFAEQPIREDSLLTGALEPTNEWYAIAKIAGIKLCQAYQKQYGRAYISAMPTNLYGPGDNYHPENSHVIPALLRRTHEAKVANAPELVIWGSGKPMREFMHADDCASALVHIMKTYNDTSHVNVGVGSDVTIKALAELIMETVGYEGELIFDTSKPDGTPKKLMENSLLRKLGWSPGVTLSEGLKQTYRNFLDHQDKLREK